MKKGLAIALIIIISGSALFIGFLWGNDFQFSDKPKAITPTLDGIINKNEWKRANYYNLPFYLDVDNSFDPLVSKRNVDGWNYISVGEDEENYYIALDLCSDRTNNLEGEWISFHTANRMPEIASSKLALQSLVDYSYEYLYYNVSNDEAFNPFVSSFPFPSNYYDIPYVPEYDSLDLIKGVAENSYLGFWDSSDGQSYRLESNYVEAQSGWSEGEFIDVMFGINITKKLPQDDVATFFSSITDLDLNFILASDLTAQSSGQLSNAEKFYCGVYEHGGIPGNISDILSFTANPNVIEFQNDTVEYATVDLDHTTINTTNGMIYFTFHCFNEMNTTYDTNYNVYFDKFSLKITTDSLGTLFGNTITSGGYDIAWSYGVSDMCAKEHRMFEFKIAKSEFPDQIVDKLYLFIAGYGTMSFQGTNYWAYPGSSEDNPYHGAPDSRSLFLSLDMSEI